MLRLHFKSFGSHKAVRSDTGVAFKGTKIVQDNLALALVCNILTLREQAAQSFVLGLTGVPLFFFPLGTSVPSLPRIQSPPNGALSGHILGLADKGSLETDTEGKTRTNAGVRDGQF